MYAACGLVLSFHPQPEKRIYRWTVVPENAARKKMNYSLLFDFITISFNRKSNALSFAARKGEKEKYYCIILSVLEPPSG